MQTEQVRKHLQVVPRASLLSSPGCEKYQNDNEERTKIQPRNRRRELLAARARVPSVERENSSAACRHRLPPSCFTICSLLASRLFREAGHLPVPLVVCAVGAPRPACLPA